MKKYLFATVLLFLLNAQSVFAQLYWDGNDTASGAGNTPAGTWDAGSLFWNTASDGTATAGAWADGNVAVFAAGIDATNAYTVTVSGTQNPAGINFEEGTVTLTGGNLNPSGSISVANGLSASIGSIIGGAITLNKVGAGTLAITANNTFSSGITVNEGVLSFPLETSATAGSANPLGTYPATATPGYITLNGGTTLRSTRLGTTAGTSSFILANRGIAISGGVNLEMTDATPNTGLLASSIIAGSDGLTKIGGGTILMTGVNTYSGDTTIKAGGLGVNGTGKFGDGTGTLVLDGGDVYSSGSRTFANRILNPVLMKTNVTIRAFNNAFTTGTRTFNFGTTSIVATNGTFTLDNKGSAGTLFIVQFNVMGGLEFTRPIVLNTGCRFDLWNDNTTVDAIFSGNISGPGHMQYTSSGTGTGGSTVVTGFNTYSGTNSLNGGYLGFGSDTLPASGPITSGPIGTGMLNIKFDPTVGFFAYGGARTVRNPITLLTVDHITIIGTNNLTMSGAVALNTTNLLLTVNNTALTTFSGPISGNTAAKILTKAGPGTLEFSGNNTYLSPTVVTAGTLLVNNTAGSGTGTGSVTVNSGSTLGGSGIISGAVSGAGNISPGTSAGTLTLGGGLDLSSGGTYVWELAANSTSAGTFDQIALTGGNLVLGGSTLSINFTNAATSPDSTNSFWQSSRVWQIVALSGSAANPGGSNFGTLLNASYAAGTFTTATNANGGINLIFTSNSAQPPVFQGTITGAGTANVGLSWSASNGTTYQVQYKDDLNAANWSVLGNVTATGNTASTNDTTGPVPQRFYRLVVQ